MEFQNYHVVKEFGMHAQNYDIGSYLTFILDVGQHDLCFRRKMQIIICFYFSILVHREL